jgi:hypothetical protein
MKVIIGIVVAALLALGVVYLTSDVARTKIDAAADQYAHWTPENIAKDPENYLNFCESQANQALQSLKASEIAVAQNRANLETMQRDAENKIGVGTKALAELKEAYKGATAWPIMWQGASRDEAWTKRQIVSLHRQVEAQQSLKVKVEQGIKNLDNQTTRIQEGRAQAQEQLAEIKTSREMLKVQKITDDLTTRLASIKSVLRTTLNTATETTGIITLDQLAAETATTVDESEFQKIMGN